MSCPDCISHQMGSSEFTDQLASIEFADDLPLAGSIELTLNCNLRCRHCYIRYDGASDGELDTEQFKLILDKLADAGVLYLLMTGGDALVRRDFKEIYLHAKKHGFLITVYTNATLVTEELADFFVQYPPRRFEITIYGHTSETYNHVVHKPFAFDRFREGVRLLLERNLPVNFKTMVMKSNFHEFQEIKNWVENELKRPFRYDTIINPRLNGDQDVLEERITPEQIVQLQYSSPEAIEDFERLRQEAEKAPPKDSRLFKCGAGIKTFHVDPRGNMHPCMMWRSTPYSLLEGSIEGWKKHVDNLREAQSPETTGCRSCQNRFACGNCAAVSALESGVPGKNLDYYCAINKEREKLLNFSRFEV
ncbi:MAG TPA: radical SAM protein [Kiritimatiellia bacterium]|nr:radical SAM protein [Kiritimatiellia bacterium]